MGYCDFHGATLQVGLAGQRPLNVHLNVRVGVPAAAQVECADGPGKVVTPLNVRAVSLYMYI